MAFGFPASFKSTVTATASRAELHDAVVQALAALGWKYQITGPDTCEAKVSVTMMSWGEIFTIDLSGENSLTVTSSCDRIQIFDWGKNRRNVETFLDRFFQILKQGRHDFSP